MQRYCCILPPILKNKLSQAQETIQKIYPYFPPLHNVEHDGSTAGYNMCNAKRKKVQTSRQLFWAFGPHQQGVTQSLPGPERL